VRRACGERTKGVVHLDKHAKTADKWLYLAVIRGVVRARNKGLVLGPDWIKQLTKMTYHDDHPFALPPCP
jgi:hypothetical protein